MTKSKELNTGFECGINDKGIMNLNLEILNACGNPKISDVNHTTNLKVLTGKIGKIGNVEPTVMVLKILIQKNCIQQIIIKYVM